MSKKIILSSIGLLILGGIWGGVRLLSTAPEPATRVNNMSALYATAQTAVPTPPHANALPELQSEDSATAPAAAPLHTFRSGQHPERTAAGRPERVRRQSAAATSATSGASTIPTSSGVTVRQGRVSLHVQNTALHTVLRDFAAQTGVTVTDRANTHTALLTLDLDNVPVEEAIKRILAAFDVFCFYRGTAKATSELHAVWIYPQGHEAQMPPGEEDNSTIVEALYHADPAERARGYEALLARPDWLSPDLLLNGLQDADAQVRFRILSQALVANIRLPIDMIERLALTDPEAEVRQAALGAMLFHADVDRQQVERIALQASTDPDPAVQSKAMELMAHIEAMQAGASAEALFLAGGSDTVESDQQDDSLGSQ